METAAEKRAWNGWSAAEDARLRELAETGTPYKDIAEIIGRGRNSCIGRAHRLGIISTWTKPAKSETPTAVKRRAAPIEKLFVAKPVKCATVRAKPWNVFGERTPQDNNPQPRYAQPEASTTAFGVPRPLMKLEATHCRWPVSGERTETLFCCAKRESLTSHYCAEHRLIAWRPTQRQLSEKAYR